MPVLNLSNTKDNAFEPIPAGIYPLEVVELSEKVGKESGVPYLNVQFAVAADHEFANRRIFTTMTYDEEKAWLLVQFLRALGYTDEELQEVSIDEEFFDKVTGMEVTANVQKEQKGDYPEKNVIKKFILPEVESA